MITFKTYFKQKLLIVAFLFIGFTAISQKPDSIKVREALKATANININNNGISLFPNLSFGKPAVIITGSVGKKNIYFEPELRWGLDGKPWSYIFWFRYKYRKSPKFGVNLGAHPSYIIRESTVTINGNLENRYVAQRYFAAEIVPTYYFSRSFALGFQYLHSIGLDSYATQKSDFVAIQPKFPQVNVSKNYYLSFYPQFFYLRLDDKNGTYISESLSLSKNNFPLSISSIFTYKLKSTIPGDDFVWNVGVNIKL
jgi:hypothetical protein